MKVVDFGHGFRYGIITGQNEFIVTESDFVHWTVPNDEPVKLEVGYNSVEGEKDAEGWIPLSVTNVVETFTLAELLSRAVETKLGIQDEEFGHYWGVKTRVEYNYHLLQETMRNIGADTSEMPKWGAK